MLKMKKHYNMDEKIVQQARSKIIHNVQKADQLYPNEENNLIKKFNEDFRSSKFMVI